MWFLIGMVKSVGGSILKSLTLAGWFLSLFFAALSADLKHNAFVIFRDSACY